MGSVIHHFKREGTALNISRKEKHIFVTHNMKTTTVLISAVYSILVLYLSIPVEGNTISHLGDSPYNFLESSSSDDYYPRAAAFHIYPISGSGDSSEEVERIADINGIGKRGALASMGEHMARLRRGGALAFNNDMARLRRAGLFSSGDMARLRRAAIMSGGDMARLRRAALFSGGDMARLRRAGIMSSGDMARL